VQHIGKREVTCIDEGHDNYGRMLGLCSAGGENLNEWMVTQGFALAYTCYSQQYIAQEMASREAQCGLWSGAFIAPW
jgi:endonuclease YncB( thermonuclease family)